ncbi:MAG TPA: hypothetical protein VFV33_15350 [Gemmatimonadaceae bacterium]|nr:hypothetical protein [Gemmatimonadaceae bacterium]
MFVGHYGFALAARGRAPTVPFWVLFLAVQWLDVVWTVLVLLGVEQVRIAPGITAANPLDLYYYPYSHSLAAAAVWGLAGALAYRRLTSGGSVAASAVVGLAIFSHWPLDLLMHRPDLPLIGDRFKVGLGLWNHVGVSLGVECLALLLGLAVAWRGEVRAQRPRPTGVLVIALVLMAIQFSNAFGPPPPSATVVAVMGLAAYLAFAAASGWWGDRRAGGRAAPTASNT